LDGVDARTARWLGVLLLVAAFLRTFGLTGHDVVTDEAFYGFRSIGLIDAVNAPSQPTPFEWFDPALPWWVHLSFHDHPPLSFWIMHLGFRIFGENLVGLRAASALAGVATVWLTYLVAWQLYRRQEVALLAAGLLAVCTCHVWFSRVGLQEAVLVFFMTLATWLFLKSLEESRYFQMAAVATGFALLTKYTAVVLLPIFLSYLVWRRRDLLTWRRVATTTLLLVVITSPAWIYNAMLFQARNHFDFQLSYLFGQELAPWKVRPGREVGGLGERLVALLPRFAQAYGPVFVALSALAVGLGIRIRRRVDLGFVFLQLAWLIALIVAIGPQLWFFAMLAPMLALLAAPGLAWAVAERRLVVAGLAVLLVGEIGFGLQSSHSAEPWGWRGWTYSVLHRHSRPWGFHALEAFLEPKMADHYAAAVFPLRYEFLRARNRETIERRRGAGMSPARVLFVTDSSISRVASLWSFSRHQVYDAWPIIGDDLYLEGIRKDRHFFAKRGFEEVVFVRAGDTQLEPGEVGRAAAEVERWFRTQGIRPQLIPREGGGSAFRVYQAKTR
jgi:uncharacterized membrane protein